MKYLKNFVNPNHCNQIYSYLKENTSKTYNVDNTRPWFENNNLFYSQIEDPYIKDLVKRYIVKLSTAISLNRVQP